MKIGIGSNIRYFVYTSSDDIQWVWALRADGKEKLISSLEAHGASYKPDWHNPKKYNDDTVIESMEDNPLHWEEVTKEEAFECLI